MSSSLDKLKALNSKLEDRLAQKKGIPSTFTRSPSISTPESKPNLPKVEEKHIDTIVEEAKPIVVPPPVSRPVAPSPVLKIPLKDENNEKIRQDNIERVKALYEGLKIFEKSPGFDTIFLYKAMNLSGIGLKEEDFGELRPGKYIQVIAITYEPDTHGKKKAKNISLGYYGKGETINPILKSDIIEFVLRWRYEKAFQNMAHYKELLTKVERPTTLF